MARISVNMARIGVKLAQIEREGDESRLNEPYTEIYNRLRSCMIEESVTIIRGNEESVTIIVAMRSRSL